MTFIRYVGIQLLAYVVDMGVYVIMLKIGFLGPIPANVVGKVAAGIFAFIAHRKFTFCTNDVADGNHQAVRYFILLVLNIPLSSGVLAVVLIWLDQPMIAKVVADVVGVAMTYWLSKSFVFVKRRRLVTEHLDSEGTDP